MTAMRALISVFLLLAFIGAIQAYYGTSLVALACAGFILWVRNVMRKQDEALLQDPANAKPLQGPTTDDLERHECECSGPKM